MATMYVM